MDTAVTFSPAAIAIVSLVVGALVTAIGKLYIDQKNYRRSLEQQAKELRSQIDDLIGRIRQLEDMRVEDMRRHSEEIKSLALKVLSSQGAMTSAVKTMTEVLRTRRCLYDETTPRPANLPQIETDVLTPKDSVHG